MNLIRKARLLLGATALLTLTGCASWSTSSVDKNGTGTPAVTSAAAATVVQPTNPAKIQISDNDVVDRRYASLGDVTVTVNKTTIFNADPTREMVNDKLREKAAELGADAVILVRYGSGGISLMSWGSLEGKGRAIKFAN